MVPPLLYFFVITVFLISRCWLNCDIFNILFVSLGGSRVFVDSLSHVYFVNKQLTAQNGAITHIVVTKFEDIWHKQKTNLKLQLIATKAQS